LEISNPHSLSRRTVEGVECGGCKAGLARFCSPVVIKVKRNKFRAPALPAWAGRGRRMVGKSSGQGAIVFCQALLVERMDKGIFVGLIVVDEAGRGEQFLSI